MVRSAFDIPEKSASEASALAAQREEQIQKGDFLGIYQSLLQSKWHEVDLPKSFAQLLRAIDIRSRQDPAAFSDELFGTMLNIAGYLTLRIQYAMVAQIADDDSRTRDRAPALRLEAMLPSLLQVQAHACEIAQSRASSARQWELARQRRLENDQLERPRRRRRKNNPMAGKPDLVQPATIWPPAEKPNGHTSQLDEIVKSGQSASGITNG